MFEKVSRLKVRYATDKGNVTTEDLWDFNLSQLNELAKGLNKKYKEFDEDDFLKVENKEKGLVKLKFDIVLKVLRTKQDEAAAAVDRKANAEKKQKFLAALEAKRDQGIGEMSVEELEAKIAELS